MAASDNPYFIQPANPMQALMAGAQGYEGARKRATEDEMKAGRMQAVQALQTGGDLKGVLGQLIGIGDVQGANAIAQFAERDAMRGHRAAQLAQSAQHHKDSLGIQQAQLKIAQENAASGRLPSGFTRDADGGLAPIPRGPADPAYIAQVNEAKVKPREFSVTDITKLADEGGKFSDLTRFADTFEDRFGGYRNPTVGAFANTAGRYLPESTVGEDVSKGATWWQDYGKYRAVVRNELYGASLQPNEQRDFEAADINPGMDQKKIRANLKIQQDIVKNGLKRKANAMIASNYNPEAIAKAYGLDLGELGVTAQPRKAAPGAPAGAGWSVQKVTP